MASTTTNASSSSASSPMAGNKTDKNSKKLVQPRLSNFFGNSKVHVSSALPVQVVKSKIDDDADENDENVPLTGLTTSSSATASSLTTHVDSPSAVEPLKISAASVAANTPISNFLKTPSIPSACVGLVTLSSSINVNININIAQYRGDEHY